MDSGPCDFPPHDAVAAAAKQAVSFSGITDKSPVPATDYRNHYRSLILESWKLFGKINMATNSSPSKKNPTPWSTSYRTSRREEVILSRLTHLYIISPNLLSPRSCPYCQYENLSVEHFFSCPLLQPLRLSLQVPPTPTQALKNNSDCISLTFQYLRREVLRLVK